MNQTIAKGAENLNGVDDATLAEASAVFEKFLRQQGLKQTRQRQLILEIFLGQEKHLTAEDLYLAVQNQNSAIGFATVYRSLHLMVESGLAREREFSAGKKYYEHVVGEEEEHHHIIDEENDKIIEFYLPESIRDELGAIAEEHGYTLTGYTLELFGKRNA